MVRRYGRVTSGSDRRNSRSGGRAVIGQRPLRLALLFLIAVVLRLLTVLLVRTVLVIVRRHLVLVVVPWRLWRYRVVRHRLPAGHRTGPVPDAPRFRERAERHVRGSSAWIRGHPRLSPRAALMPDDHRVHGQVDVTGPALLFVRRRRR